MIKLSQKQTIVFLCITILIFSLITFLPYIRFGQYSIELTTSDISRFAIATNDMLKTKHINYEVTDSISTNWLAAAGYPPGFIIIFAVLRSLSSLNIITLCLLFHFVILVLFVLAVYILSYYLTGNKFVSFFASFFIATLRNDTSVMPSFFLVQPSSFALVVLPLLFYSMHKGLFKDRKYMLFFVVFLSTIFSTHNRTTVMTFWPITIYGIALLSVYKRKSIKKLFLLFSSVIIGGLISAIWWLRVNIIKQHFVEEPQRLFNTFLGWFRLINNPKVIFFLVVLIIFVLISFLVLKKKEILLNFFKHKAFWYALSYLFFFIYVIWFWYKVNLTGDIQTLYTALYGAEPKKSIFLLLNLGLIVTAFIPLGLVHLFWYKTSATKKILLYSWFFVLVVNFFGLISFYPDTNRTVPIISLPCSIIAAIGVYAFVQKIKKYKLIVLLFLLLVLSFSLYPSITCLTNIKLANILPVENGDIVLTSKWIDKNIKQDENIIGDVQNIRAMQMFINQNIINDFEVDPSKMYKTSELYKTWTSTTPDTIVPFMNSYGANYFVANKEALINLIDLMEWYLTYDIFKNYEFYGYISNKIGRNADITFRFDPNIKKLKSELFDRKGMTYDGCRYLDKIYSAGDSAIYKLNNKEVDARYKSIEKRYGASPVTINSIGLPKQLYLTDDVKYIEIEMNDKETGKMKVNLSFELRDMFNESVYSKQKELNLNPGINKERLSFVVSKFDWFGNYSFVVALSSGNKMYDIKQRISVFDESPILIITDGSLIKTQKNRLSRIAYPVIENRGDKTENITAILILKNNGIEKEIKQNVMVKPKEVKYVEFWGSINESGIYDIFVNLKTDYGLLSYDFGQPINVTQEVLN